jgi:muramoyltetrapeptide carboxypeptidase
LQKLFGQPKELLFVIATSSNILMILPPNLQKGDTVALISTARKIDVSHLEFVLHLLNSWGLEVIQGKNLLSSFHQFAGTDEERANDLQYAINDSKCKAIFCFRGGYGTVRIIEKVDFSPLLTYPKWVVGYSDVTALHNTLNNMGLASLHATMPVNFNTNTPEALFTLKKALFGNPESYLIDTHPLNKFGEAKGELVGGNLSMLLSLSGTKYDLDTKGKILILEDLDEYLYHIDRMLWNLKLGGKLDHLKGLIIGGFTDMHDNKVPFGMDAYQIISETVKEYSFPVCFNFPFGHIDDNRALILGKDAKLLVNKDCVVFNQN